MFFCDISLEKRGKKCYSRIYFQRGIFMESKQSKKRILYFDVLRIISAFAVIMLHVSSDKLYSFRSSTFEWNVFNFYDSISRFGVPVFVMISGSLFLSKPTNIKRLWKNNILRLTATFVCWYIVYQIAEIILKSPDWSPYHLWFLPMLITTYMTVPFLKKIAEDDRLLKYFLILALVFAFIIPQFVSVLKYLNSNTYRYIANFISQIEFHFLLGYTSYFLLGYYLNKTELSGRTRLLLYVLCAVGFVGTVIASNRISVFKASTVTIFYKEFTLNVLFEAVGVFVFVKYALRRLEARLGGFVLKLITLLSKYSFGIYLVHVLVLELLKRAGITTVSFNPVFSVPVISAAMFLISLAASALLNQIPIIKKYIV